MGTALVCPHCGAQNALAGSFCESCGKALPSVQSTGPRIVESNQFAATTAGQKLQVDDLQRQVKTASGALMVVAILQTLAAAGCFIVYSLASSRAGATTGPRASLVLIAMIVELLIAAGFWCLYSWAQSQPLPSAIVGLVAYGTLVGMNVFMAISRDAASPAGGGTGIGIGWLDVVILLVLFRAVNAGVNCRKIQSQNQEFIAAGANPALVPGALR